MVTFFVNLAINPPFWFLVGGFFLWLKKWNKWLVIIYLVALYALTTPFLPYRLAVYLEDQYPALKVEELDTSKQYHILVLGASMGEDKRMSAISQLGHVSLTRLCEAIRISKKLPHCNIITSGANFGRTFSQAELTKWAAIELGVDSSIIFTQPTPRNTAEEAQAYFERFGNQTQLIVATSALHTSRALMLLRKKGIEPIPAPTDYIVKREDPITWQHYIPSLGYFPKIQKCLHELVGYWKDRLS